jgi:hypothetical protein
MQRLVIRSILIWICFVPIAIGNGIIRDRLYGPRVGDLAAHQISTVFGSVAFVSFAYAMLRNLVGEMNARAALLVGGSWVITTMGFEFWLGRCLRGLAWRHLLADYDVFRGRVWGLFLLVILVTPSLTRWLQQVGWPNARPTAEGTR